MTADGQRRAMNQPDLDPILIQVTIPLPIPMIFAALTEAKQLSGWMCDAASVEPRVGGRYELTFDSEEIPFVSRGHITRLTPEHEIGFTWVPPTAFDPNAPGAPAAAPSEVYVRLQESPEGIDVTLEHSGWRNSEAGEEARSWHFRLWDARLHELKDYLLKAAYG
jgi:uncharacterized protein YndB with AHSA1/START domain